MIFGLSLHHQIERYLFLMSNLKLTTMKNFNAFKNLNNNGARLISINNYEAKTSGEIANHLINTGADIMNAKKGDLKRIQNAKESDLMAVADKGKIALDVVRLALSEMLESALKNTSENFEERTNQSKGQTNNYVFIAPAVKLDPETETLYIFGQAIRKNVIKKGEYKEVKSAPKTIAKNMLKKQLGLRTDKFRNFIVAHVKDVTLNGTVIDVNL